MKANQLQESTNKEFATDQALELKTNFLFREMRMSKNVQ